MILILAVIFALGIAFFATENTALVTLHLAGYVLPGIPLYLVMAVSLLIGLFGAWLAGLINNVSNMFALQGKNTRLRQATKQVASLESKVRDLELENTQLKGEYTSVDEIVEKNQEQPHDDSSSKRSHHSILSNFGSLFR